MTVRDISTIRGLKSGSKPPPLKTVRTKKVYNTEFFWFTKFPLRKHTFFISRPSRVDTPSRAKTSILKISYSGVTTQKRENDISKAGKSGHYAFYTGNLRA